MPTALYRFILAVLLVLPVAAHAGDADDFLAANPTQQAKLLQDWAAQPDPARVARYQQLYQRYQQWCVAAEPQYAARPASAKSLSHQA